MSSLASAEMTRSARDARHDRYEAHSDHRHGNPSLYWKEKRQQWTQEAQTADDVFSQGGLFRGFGEHRARLPAAEPPPFPSQVAPFALRQEERAQWETGRGGRYGTLGAEERRGPGGRWRDAEAAGDGSTALLPSIHRRPTYGTLDASPPPQVAASGGQYMAGLHELRGGPSASEVAAKREAARQYQQMLQQQMREKEERQKREKIEREQRERREEEEARNYNPFGRGGGGAPMRDEDGHIVANRRQAAMRQQQQQQQPALSPAPAEGGRGRVGLRSEDAAAQRSGEKGEWQRSLAVQIEERKERKRKEEERERDEDRREELRLADERQRLEAEYQKEKEKEREVGRRAEEEAENKRRKKQGAAAAAGGKELTDYEKEQMMKGRAPHQHQRQQGGAEEEERKNSTTSLPRRPLSSSYRNVNASGAGGSRRVDRAQVYAEMEREMERLRSEVSSQTEKMRRRVHSRPLQPPPQLELVTERVLPLRCDADSLQHFLHSAGEAWTDRSESSSFRQSDSELGGDDDALSGESTFIGLPAAYESRPATAVSTSQSAQPMTVVVRPPSLVRSLPVAAAEEQVEEREEEELYADEEFHEFSADDSAQDGFHVLHSEAEQQQQEAEQAGEAAAEPSTGPSEHSKIVSETDLRDDRLEQFILSDADGGGSERHHTQRKGRRKWKLTEP